MTGDSSSWLHAAVSNCVTKADEGNTVSHREDKTTPPMVRLIEGCWHAEYAQRPTFGSGSAPMSPFS